MLKIKRLFFIISIVCIGVTMINTTAMAIDAGSTGLNETAGVGMGNSATDLSGVPFKGDSIAGTIGKIVGVGLSFIGVIFLVLMIYGGFTWMMARGNQQEVDKAKDLIYSAVIGLIIVLAAYAITAFVGSILS